VTKLCAVTKLGDMTVHGSNPVPVLTSDKLGTVPVPYLDHKKYSFQQKIGKHLAFLHSNLFHKEKLKSFIKVIIKFE
jgi:hypothetical protein